MKKKSAGSGLPELDALRAALDEYEGRYRSLKGAADYGEYASTSSPSADEETLTEPLLQTILESVLGFGKGDYFPQLGNSGLKPDFTPSDLIAHSFILDAKGSGESLGAHVAQIKGYVDQRSLNYGVLFNLREFRVYERGKRTHSKTLSFSLLPLWRLARGEAMPGPELDAFTRFLEKFRHRTLSVEDKIAFIRSQPSWSERLSAGDETTVDVEFLVAQLRLLARLLADDAAVRTADLDAHLHASPGREGRLVDELKQIALDLEPGAEVDALPSLAAAWREGSGLHERVWRQYLLRVSYLCLTRILLYRAWEDVQFVEERLYDGGFDEAYERLDGNIRDVLRRAFTLGSERYRTLFAAENNYEWYRPSEPALVETLYRLGAVPLGRLDQDALGSLYVSYVDEIDRDRLGQFFTPRDVVRFMLDRVGFSGPNGLFRVEGDERKPLRVLDFATGSGGFLVEAARRIIDDSGIAETDAQGLGEALTAVSTGLYGAEISPFPYYLTEINLLLQVSRLLGRLRLLHIDPPQFMLGVVRADTLATKSSTDASLDVDPNLRGDAAELVPHDIYDVVPIEQEKRDRYRELKRDGEFDLVIGNPPYVAEANNKPLFDHFRRLSGWRGIYRGKTDYLYYFLWLAVEKLKPGGRLCVIVPAGWMNAGNADFLRQKLAGELTLEQLFLFGGYRLFAADQGPAPTPTVESAILVATKAAAPKGHRLKVVILDDEAVAAAAGRAALLAAMASRAEARSGTRGGLKSHLVAQADLRPEYPWPVKYGAADVPTRVVAHLQRLLDSDALVPLASDWSVFTGIETAADAYTRRIQRRLSSAQVAKLHAEGLSLGDPIMELPSGAERALPWSKHPALLARSPEPRAILYGAVDDDDYVHYVVLRAGLSVPVEVINTLERWKPVLASRAEIGRNPRRTWWETAWPRDAGELSAPKVIALYRTDRGRFALDETGRLAPGKKCTVVVGKGEGAPVAYLCGLLNSELLDLWTAVRGKTPWHVRRNYEPKRMNEIPYRRHSGDPRADEVAARVREIAANRRALLPYRPLVRDLGRVVKDPWKDGPVVLDRAALVASLPAEERVSVRLDPLLTATVGETPMGKPRREAPERLAFKRGRIATGTVEGPAPRLDRLEELLGRRAVDDVRSVELPKDDDALAARGAAVSAEVTTLLADGRRLVEEVERLVCSLYDVPDDLTEAVVEHAVARARAGMPDDGVASSSD